MPDLNDPAVNPDVSPARPWQWSAFVSTLLVGIEAAAVEAGAIDNPPRWLVVALAATPWVVRLVRGFVSKRAVSFRRAPAPKG